MRGETLLGMVLSIHVYSVRMYLSLDLHALSTKGSPSSYAPLRMHSLFSFLSLPDTCIRYNADNTIMRSVVELLHQRQFISPPGRRKRKDQDIGLQ